MQRLLRVIVLTSVVLLPATAFAQASIVGTARDASGAVLPGVTVEASSPALIEKVRTVVTDGEGRYNIVGLSPGAYTVTFTLPGFSTQRRDGIELTAGFTASVNADMVVGSLDETITVSGVSPLVDTQNVRKQTVLSSELLDALPTIALVCDIVYVPLETPLLTAARRRGNPTVDGLGMLLHQARPAWQAWFGIEPEVTPELRALIEATFTASSGSDPTSS